MGRRRKAPEEVNTEEVKTEVNQEGVENAEVQNTVTESNAEVKDEPAKETDAPETTDNAEVETVEEEVKDAKDAAVDEMINEIESADDDDEKLISSIVVLEHTFSKKVIERGFFDVYKKGKMWIFKDRNGHEISTHFGEIENALRLFVARLYPISSRPRGSTFTWSEID